MQSIRQLKQNKDFELSKRHGNISSIRWRNNGIKSFGFDYEFTIINSHLLLKEQYQNKVIPYYSFANIIHSFLLVAHNQH